MLHPNRQPESVGISPRNDTEGNSRQHPSHVRSAGGLANVAHALRLEPSTEPQRLVEFLLEVPHRRDSHS